jgi:hypothetical protein
MSPGGKSGEIIFLFTWIEGKKYFIGCDDSGPVKENTEQAAGFLLYSDTAGTFISSLSVTGTSYLTRNAIIEYT